MRLLSSLTLLALPVVLSLKTKDLGCLARVELGMAFPVATWIPLGENKLSVFSGYSLALVFFFGPEVDPLLG